ncbi:MAG: PAS domain S-box protein [Synechococcales bacterium]|nr:PAS domain S-box protein [Synechococcales bacterium]
MFTPAAVFSQVDLAKAIAPPPRTLAPTDNGTKALAMMGFSPCGCSSGGVQPADHLDSPPTQSPCVWVQEGDRLVGRVTEGDLLRMMVSGKNPAEVAIATIMSAPGPVLPLTDPVNVQVPFDLFQHHQVHQLPVVDAAGRMVGVLTAERLGQLILQAQHQTEQLLIHLFAALEDVVLVLDRQGIHRQVFFTRSDKFYCSRDELLGQSVNDLFSPDQAAFFLNCIWQTLDSGEAQKYEYNLPIRDQEQWFAATCSPLTADTVLWLARDVSDRKQTELERQRATQALERLNQDLEARVAERSMALQASEERWQLALNGANDGIWDWDMRNNKIFLSSRWKQMRGFAEDEIGDSPDECLSRIHPDDYDWVMAAVADHFAGRTEFFEAEYRTQRQDGSYLWVLDRAQASRDASGQVVRMCGSETDITQRKRADDELRYSRDLREAIFNESADALFLVDPQTLLTLDCNQRAAQLFEVADKRELLGIEGHTLHHRPYSSEELAAINTEMIANGFWSREIEYVTRRGRVFWGNIAATPITVAGRTMNLVRVTDISDRKRLEHQQQRLVTILEASTDYIGMLDARTGQVIWGNRAIKQLCGLDSDAAVSQRTPADYHPQWAMNLLEQEAVPAAIATGSWLGETALLDATGQEIPVSQLLLAHKSPQGEVEFFSTIMRDMRVHKEYERQLERTNAELAHATRLKDEFLANMSHELRTPLTAILGMSEVVQEKAFGDLNDKQRQYIQIIHSSGQHLLTLINDILDLSKISVGKLELHLAPVRVDDLCNSSLLFVKQQAYKKQIQLSLTLAPDLGAIAVDERRMRQVLINLLTNAVKFTHDGGQVTLKVGLQRPEGCPVEGSQAAIAPAPAAPRQPALPNSDPWIYFSVIDTGIGIAAEDQAKLFRPFVQIDSRLNRRYEGTGLGLVLVKQIVELHGGQVSLISQPEQGSCFTVCLPYCLTPFPTPTPLPAPISSTHPPIHPPPLILLAEDNPDTIVTLTDYLELQGYRLLIAKNGQEVMNLMSIHPPNLLLIDIQMPNVDGLQVMQTLRQNPRFAQIPILALTALAMEGDRDRCLAAGADGYLPKPVNLKQLVATIQQLLDRRENTCGAIALE